MARSLDSGDLVAMLFGGFAGFMAGVVVMQRTVGRELNDCETELWEEERAKQGFPRKASKATNPATRIAELDY